MINIKEIKTMVFKDKTIFGAGIMSLGIFLGSIFNYMTQVFLGRNLSIEDYGTFNSLFSFTVILAIPSLVFTSSMIKMVAGLKAKNDFKTLTNIFLKSTRLVIISGLILSSLVLIFKKQIFSYLNVSDFSITVPFIVYVALLFISILPRSYLQGLLKFKAVSFHAVTGPAMRLGFCLLFVLYGLRVSGVFYAVALSTFLNFLIGTFFLKKHYDKGEEQDLSKYYKKLATFGIAILVMRASLSALSNIDLVLVKHFFSPLDAGLYSGIVTIGKIILFGTGIIGAVMFPIISNLYESGEEYLNKFSFFFLIQVLLVLGGIAVFTLFPEFITINMFGPAYRPAVEYLSKYSLFIGLFSTVSFVFQFLLAIDKIKASAILLVGVLVQIILINLMHTSLDQVININIAVMSGILITSLGYLKLSIST
ncbi:oligosaccharide flippase family protein [Patescibacteria group bacterium]